MTLPREDLFIKEKWHQQRKEESMIEKEDTSVEIYAHELVCLSIPNKPIGNQSHNYSLIVYLDNIILFLF